MEEQQRRAVREELTEEELAIFDFQKLTKAQTTQVKWNRG